jgi:beta-phosphoglucomutase-like phosphatase (HAD superfamily)
MERFKAALFDMDGVVIDSRPGIHAFWEAVAVEQGVALTDDDYDRHIHGVPTVQTIRALFPAITPDEEDAFLDRVDRHELALRYREVAGAGSLLRSLQAAGARTALVTSGMPRKVAEVFRQLPLGGLFDVVVTAGDIERGKPDPACYLAAARRLGVLPSACVVFEDAVNGVRSAVAAGSACIGVGSGRLAAESVRHVIPDFTDVRVEVSGVEVRMRWKDGFTIALSSGGRD